MVDTSKYTDNQLENLIKDPIHNDKVPHWDAVIVLKVRKRLAENRTFLGNVTGNTHVGATAGFQYHGCPQLGKQIKQKAQEDKQQTAQTLEDQAKSGGESDYERRGPQDFNTSFQRALTADVTADAEIEHPTMVFLSESSLPDRTTNDWANAVRWDRCQKALEKLKKAKEKYDNAYDNSRAGLSKAKTQADATQESHDALKEYNNISNTDPVSDREIAEISTRDFRHIASMELGVVSLATPMGAAYLFGGLAVGNAAVGDYWGAAGDALGALPLASKLNLGGLLGLGADAAKTEAILGKLEGMSLEDLQSLKTSGKLTTDAAKIIDDVIYWKKIEGGNVTKIPKGNPNAETCPC